MLYRSQRNFAHVTTVTLSWRVQNFFVIGGLPFKPEYCKFGSNFKFSRNIVSGTGARISYWRSEGALGIYHTALPSSEPSVGRTALQWCPLWKLSFFVLCSLAWSGWTRLLHCLALKYFKLIWSTCLKGWVLKRCLRLRPRPSPSH